MQSDLMTNPELLKQRVRDEVDIFSTTGRVPETLHRRLETGDGLEFLGEDDWEAILNQTGYGAVTSAQPWKYEVDSLLPKFELAPLTDDEVVSGESVWNDDEIDGDDVPSLWKLVVHYRALERAARAHARSDIEGLYADAHRTIQPIIERMAIVKARVENNLEQEFADEERISDPDPDIWVTDGADTELPRSTHDAEPGLPPRTSDLERLIRADVERFRQTGEITEGLDARLVSGQGLEFLSRSDYNELVEATIEDAQASGILRDCAVSRVHDELGLYLQSAGDAPAYSDDERELAELESILHKRVVQYRMQEKAALSRGDHELGLVHGNLRREIKSCLEGVDVVELMKRGARQAASE
jgi:hypothetical protein